MQYTKLGNSAESAGRGTDARYGKGDSLSGGGLPWDWQGDAVSVRYQSGFRRPGRKASASPAGNNNYGKQTGKGSRGTGRDFRGAYEGSLNAINCINKAAEA